MVCIYIYIHVSNNEDEDLIETLLLEKEVGALCTIDVPEEEQMQHMTSE